MPELTDTELIAERLFGWELSEAPPVWGNKILRWYTKGSDASTRLWIGVDDRGVVNGGEINFRDVWFDPDNWNDIRRMEDALAGKGLTEKYILVLDSWYTVAKSDVLPSGLIDWQTLAMLRATAPQRVAACVKVLREVQG